MSSAPLASSEAAAPPKPSRSSAGAVLVALGIFLSRIAGLVRTKAMAYYLGSDAAADAFNAAFRIPNLLANLFGEGALSASFIPVYAALLARGESEEADRVAGAVGTLLALLMAVLVLLGVVAAPWLVYAVAPGFHGETHELAIHLVRVIFPGIGLMVLSAWCLGILNSHRRFLLSYAAPVVWNAAMITALLAFGPRQSRSELVVTLAWGSVVGAGAQFLVQLPSVLSLAPRLRLGLGLGDPNVADIFRNFGPAFVSRGVVQISSYVDAMLASLLPVGSVAIFGYAQTLNLLPVSLFGMSVSASELPAMSSAIGTDEEIAATLRKRLDGGLGRIAFFVIPSAMAFLAIGDVIAAGLFQSGHFTRDDSVRVWMALAGSAIGLLAQTWGRLYSSTWYALKDTKTPLRFAMIRVAITTALGWWMSSQLPGLLGVDAKWGVAGLTASAGMAGWIEYTLLKRSLDRRIGRTGLPGAQVAKLWGCAAVAGASGWAIKLALSALPPIVLAVVVCGVYGAVYLGLTAALGFPEVRSLARRVRRR